MNDTNHWSRHGMSRRSHWSCPYRCLHSYRGWTRTHCCWCHSWHHSIPSHKYSYICKKQDLNFTFGYFFVTDLDQLSFTADFFIFFFKCLKNKYLCFLAGFDPVSHLGHNAKTTGMSWFFRQGCETLFSRGNKNLWFVQLLAAYTWFDILPFKGLGSVKCLTFLKEVSYPQQDQNVFDQKYSKTLILSKWIPI